MWEQIRSNQRRAGVLVVLMAGLLFLIGYVVGTAFAGSGLAGLVVAFVIWLVLTLVSFSSGDQVFLSLSRARKIKREDHPALHNVVEEMIIASGLPKIPDIYIIDDDAPNAFATGRNPERASVAVTTGLLKTLTRDELQGVIAHELGHVKNRDILYMMLVGVMMGTVVILADVALRALFWGGGVRRTSSRGRGGGQAQAIMMLVALVLIILAPIIAQLIYFALSRKREYLADASSALFTRYPEGLAGALEKISRTPRKLRSANRATAPMYIVNPLKAGRRGLSDLSSTHPPTSERIRILRSMGGGAGFANYDNAFREVTGRPVGVVPASALRGAEKVSVTKPEKKEDVSPLGRARETTDMLWRLNKYAFIACACGTKLKVPPAHAGRQIKCLHCGKAHTVPKAAG